MIDRVVSRKTNPAQAESAVRAIPIPALRSLTVAFVMDEFEPGLAGDHGLSRQRSSHCMNRDRSDRDALNLSNPIFEMGVRMTREWTQCSQERTDLRPALVLHGDRQDALHRHPSQGAKGVNR